MMRANHEAKWVSVAGISEPVKVDRGQFLTGRFSLRKSLYPGERNCDPSPSTVWRKLETLKNMGNLLIETNSRFSIVTIVNFNLYNDAPQENEQTNEQPVNSRCTAGEQPVNTNKNYKNYKKFNKPTLEEVSDYCSERQNSVRPQAFIDYYESVGWAIGKKPMKDWKAAVRTWEQNDRAKASQPHAASLNRAPDPCPIVNPPRRPVE
jgi:hypothetical protein